MLIGFLLAIGVALRVQSFPVHARTPDEQFYTLYGQVLERDGLGGFPRLIREYLARPELHGYPAPTRVGHLAIVATAMHLTGSPTVQTAALVSACASVLSLFLLVGIGTTFIEPRSAAVALLFAIVSPLDLAMARRAWGDELVALSSLGLTYLFLKQLAEPRHFRWTVAFLTLAACSVLIKETGLLFLALGSLGLAFVARRSIGWRGSFLVLGGGALALSGVLAVLVLACGGVESFRVALESAATATPNEYMRRYQTGGWDYYARGLALLQPVSMALGFFAALWFAARAPFASGGPGHALKTNLREPRAPSVLAWFVIGFMAIALVYPQKNMRFLSALYPMIELLAGTLLVTRFDALAVRLPRPALRVVAVVACVALAGSALADHARFVDTFIRRGIPDLATPWFAR